MLTLKWATSAEDICAAQALRYHVFYEELGAVPCGTASMTRRDADRFDEACDHLLVVSSEPGEDGSDLLIDEGKVIGTYRLLRQSAASRCGGFYAQRQFNIEPLLSANPHLKFLELGRSCVLKSQRSKPVIELLWRGISDYLNAYNLDAMIGCASLPGTNPDNLAEPLSYLAQNFLAPDGWRATAHPDQYLAMNRLPRGYYDERQAMVMLPPLIKGYLRAGARIGDGAVVDAQFNTTDILIVLPVSDIKSRYFKHFGVQQQSHQSAPQPFMS